MSTQKENAKIFCWNCELEINADIDKCPECNTLLSPNEYISWNLSWHLFLFVLCIIPIIIGLLAFYFA